MGRAVEPSSDTCCVQFPLLRTSQSLKWEGVWRELGCLAPGASFAVREESGHSLKSSLSVSVLSSLGPFISSSLLPFLHSSLLPFMSLSFHPFIPLSFHLFVCSSLPPFFPSSLCPFHSFVPFILCPFCPFIPSSLILLSFHSFYHVISLSLSSYLPFFSPLIHLSFHPFILMVPDRSCVLTVVVCGVSCFPACNGDRYQELVHSAQQRRPVEDTPGRLAAIMGWIFGLAGHHTLILCPCRSWPGSREETPVS